MRRAVPGFDYDTHEETHRFGAHTLRLRLLDDFNAATVAVHRALAPVVPASVNLDLTPMFGVIWASSLPLTLHMAEAELEGLDVLELGCGLALPSMLAARRGARVLATDMHPHVAAFLRDNAALNQLDVTYQELDWRQPRLPRTFDRVVAADVLFARENAALLARLYADALAPDGVGWLTDPGRAWLEEFVDEAQRAGLSVDIDVVDVPGEADVPEVFWLTLRQAPDAMLPARWR